MLKQVQQVIERARAALQKVQKVPLTKVPHRYHREHHYMTGGGPKSGVPKLSRKALQKELTKQLS